MVWRGRNHVSKKLRGYESSTYWIQGGVSITSKNSVLPRKNRFTDRDYFYLLRTGNTGVKFRKEGKQTGSIYPTSERKWSEIWESTIQPEDQPEENRGLISKSEIFCSGVGVEEDQNRDQNQNRNRGVGKFSVGGFREFRIEGEIRFKTTIGKLIEKIWRWITTRMLFVTPYQWLVAECGLNHASTIPTLGFP